MLLSSSQPLFGDSTGVKASRRALGYCYTTSCRCCDQVDQVSVRRGGGPDGFYVCDECRRKGIETIRKLWQIRQERLKRERQLAEERQRAREEQRRQNYLSRISSPFDPELVYRELWAKAVQEHGSLHLISQQQLRDETVELLQQSQERSVAPVRTKLRNLWLGAGPIITHVSDRFLLDLIQRSGYPLEKIVVID